MQLENAMNKSIHAKNIPTNAINKPITITITIMITSTSMATETINDHENEIKNEPSISDDNLSNL